MAEPVTLPLRALAQSPSHAVPQMPYLRLLSDQCQRTGACVDSCSCARASLTCFGIRRGDRVMFTTSSSLEASSRADFLADYITVAVFASERLWYS